MVGAGQDARSRRATPRSGSDRALAGHRRPRPARLRPAARARRTTPARRGPRGRTSTSLDITDSAAVDAAVADFAPGRRRQRRRLHRGRRGRDATRSTPTAVNATGPAVLAAALARQRRPAGPRLDRLRLRRRRRPALRGRRRARARSSAYGRTKLAGEQAVRELLPDASYVVRTAWVYGATGANFVKTMARLERERETVSVVDDQRGSPTWSLHLARALVELGPLGRAAPGIYHCTGAGDTTWFGFAQAIFAELGADPARVLPTTTARVPAAGAAAGVLGAVRRGLARRRADADARLARRAARGVRGRRRAAERSRWQPSCGS